MNKPERDDGKVVTARRVVTLRADWHTQWKLREWAMQCGFDLAWSYSGEPQSSWDFDFHVTLVYSVNAIAHDDDGSRHIDPITLTPSKFEVFGESTPALAIDAHDRMSAIRRYYVDVLGLQPDPAYPTFRPHVSLSYKWSGKPEIVAYAPALPDFPLVFDAITVAQIEDEKGSAKDAKSAPIKIMTTADRATISGTRKTADGYLVTDARVARGNNIQDYYGHEIGEGEPNELFRIWRPEAEIFKRDSLATFAHKPVTLGHPTVEVTPESWRRDAIGHVGSEVVRDGEFVRVPLVVMDKSAIDAIEAGTREISMGYDCELVMQKGTTPDGRAYDAFQKNIRINHCAVVPAGRAGPQCRIGDSAKRTNKQEGFIMAKSVTIDGKAIEVADNVAALLTDGKLGEALSSAHKAVTDAIANMNKAEARADVAEKAVADLKAENTDLKGKVTTDAALADKIGKAAAELAIVLDAAKALAPDLDTKGKTADEIKRGVVGKHLGDDKVKDKSADYIAATFDLLTSKIADADPFADLIKSGGGKTSTADAAKAAREYEERQSKAWQH